MITAWMLYAVVVGALLGTGGLALERLQRVRGRPSRWIWVGSMVASVAWPLMHWAWENRPRVAPVLFQPNPPQARSSEPLGMALPFEPITVEISGESVLRLLDGPILVAWALSTGLLFLFLMLLFIRTHRLRKRWPAGIAAGHRVLFSTEWGPAVVGFLRPQIVLPKWCLDVDDRTLRFILDHELEHVRAGDLRLLILAGVLPVLVPWHPLVWWQWTRLRTAIEGDCDLRVLGKNPGKTMPYVELLLDVGRRATQIRPLAAMLSEPYRTLKRRIRIMTMPLPKKPWLKGLILAGTGSVLFVLAGSAPGPTDGLEGGFAQEHQAVPRFTPYTVRPAIRNHDQVVETLRKDYEPILRETGLQASVHLWFFLDEEGRVQNVQVNQSSGHRDLDRAAIQVAEVIEFSPALNRDQRRQVWVSLPIAFTTPGADQPPELAGSAEAVAAGWRTRPARADEDAAIGGPTGEVGGTVSDAQSGAPIPYAQVFIAGTGFGTLSDQAGRFLIQHVPVGNREVVVELIGYGHVSEVVGVMTDQRADLDFGLQVTAVPLEVLIVEGRIGPEG